ncbi:MAG: superoxide dismutase [Cu-Zn] SodC [Marinobacter sp.]
MNRLRLALLGFGLSAALAAPTSHADASIDVEMYEATSDGRGDAIGTVTLEEHRYGVLIKPSLEQLEPGLHGFHLHENPDCGPGQKNGKKAAAIAAGGHYDPEDTNAHRGPYDPDGHLGDLPALYVTEEGEADVPLLAPRLQLSDLTDRSLVIHKQGDNYSDDPEPLGGGGSRVACGVVSTD